MASEIGMNDTAIGQSFRMEFKGKRRTDGATLAPPCLWKGNPKDTVCISKTFGKSKMLCCDFLLLPPFPRAVVEVKAAAPHQTNKINSIFRDFEKDLRKCEEWLKPDSEPGIRETFRIERLDYALAILVDLTEGQDITNLWKSAIDENELFKRGIIACLISPRSSSSPPEIATRYGKKGVEPTIFLSQPRRQNKPLSFQKESKDQIIKAQKEEKFMGQNEEDIKKMEVAAQKRIKDAQEWANEGFPGKIEGLKINGFQCRVEPQKFVVGPDLNRKEKHGVLFRLTWAEGSRSFYSDVCVRINGKCSIIKKTGERQGPWVPMYVVDHEGKEQYVSECNQAKMDDDLTIQEFFKSTLKYICEKKFEKILHFRNAIE